MDNLNQTNQSPQQPQQVNPTVPPVPEPPKTFGWLKWVLIVVLVALLSSTTTYLVLQSQNQTQQSQISPTPSPAETSVKEGDPTANWKTYTNTKYEFSFKYPPAWIFQRGPGELTDQQLGEGNEVDIYDPNESIPGIGFGVKINELHQTGLSKLCDMLEDCIKKVTSYFPKEVTTENEIFLVNKAVRITYTITNQLYSQTFSNLFVIINDDFYNFDMSSGADIYSSNRYIFDQILSTFQFTD